MEEHAVTPDRTLDARGEICPGPVVLALEALQEMEDGQVLEVITDHVPAVENIPPAVNSRGHEVLVASQVGRGLYRILIRARRKA
jgi:tRNA 2-thiouridine synthesizing protein A